MPPASIFPLVLFAVLMLFVSLLALSASGHFPKGSRLPAVAVGLGPVVLWMSMGLAAASVIVGLATAWMTFPWYAAVIGGGGAILLAPLVLQMFPDHVVDGKSGLIVFSGGATVLSLLLFWLIYA